MFIVRNNNMSRSMYLCSCCDEYKLVDEHGCNEDPSDECECWCDDCIEREECLIEFLCEKENLND